MDYFQKEISNNLPETEIVNIEINNSKNQIEFLKPFWNQSWFMWICIAIGGVSILFFCTKLLKDLK